MMKPFFQLRNPAFPAAMIALTALFMVWLWFYHPSCYVPVTRYEQITHMATDTVPAPATFAVLDIQTSDVIEGKRPRETKDRIDEALKFFIEKTGGLYQESYFYVNQGITIRNTAMDTAIFAVAGWIVLSVMPDRPLVAPQMTKELAPGQAYTYNFLIELPKGFDYRIIERPTAQSCDGQAGSVPTVRHYPVTEWVMVRKKCNKCCQVCEDESRPEDTDSGKEAGAY